MVLQNKKYFYCLSILLIFSVNLLFSVKIKNYFLLFKKKIKSFYFKLNQIFSFLKY